jgi:hypothetical protein
VLATAHLSKIISLASATAHLSKIAFNDMGLSPTQANPLFAQPVFPLSTRLIAFHH